jgi:hypothetical protein
MSNTTVASLYGRIINNHSTLANQAVSPADRQRHSATTPSLLERLNQRRYRPLTLISAGYCNNAPERRWLTASESSGVWVPMDENHNGLRSFLNDIVRYKNNVSQLFSESPSYVEHPAETFGHCLLGSFYFCFMSIR